MIAPSTAFELTREEHSDAFVVVKVACLSNLWDDCPIFTAPLPTATTFSKPEGKELHPDGSLAGLAAMAGEIDLGNSIKPNGRNVIVKREDHLQFFRVKLVLLCTYQYRGISGILQSPDKCADLRVVRLFVQMQCHLTQCQREHQLYSSTLSIEPP